jgi:hypothetical protein
MSEYRILRKRIKTNIRQAKTLYKIRQVYFTVLTILNGQFTKHTVKTWRKILLGLPKYTLDKCTKL